jgi:hypothetical protein
MDEILAEEEAAAAVKKSPSVPVSRMDEILAEEVEEEKPAPPVGPVPTHPAEFAAQMVQPDIERSKKYWAEGKRPQSILAGGSAVGKGLMTPIAYPLAMIGKAIPQIGQTLSDVVNKPFQHYQGGQPTTMTSMAQDWAGFPFGKKHAAANEMAGDLANLAGGIFSIPGSVPALSGTMKGLGNQKLAKELNLKKDIHAQVWNEGLRGKQKTAEAKRRIGGIVETIRENEVLSPFGNYEKAATKMGEKIKARTTEKAAEPTRSPSEILDAGVPGLSMVPGYNSIINAMQGRARAWGLTDRAGMTEFIGKVLDPHGQVFPINARGVRNIPIDELKSVEVFPADNLQIQIAKNIYNDIVRKEIEKLSPSSKTKVATMANAERALEKAAFKEAKAATPWGIATTAGIGYGLGSLGNVLGISSHSPGWSAALLPVAHKLTQIAGRQGRGAAMRYGLGDFATGLGPTGTALQTKTLAEILARPNDTTKSRRK